VRQIFDSLRIVSDALWLAAQRDWLSGVKTTECGTA
jgi:hypothetical protein